MPSQARRGALHPLDVSRAFGAGWQLFRVRWRTHFGMLLGLFVPVYALNALWLLVYGEEFEVWAAALRAAQLGGGPFDPADLPALPLDGLLIVVGLNLALAIVGVLGTAAVINVLGWTYGGGHVTARRALGFVARRSASLIGASLLFALAVLGILLVGFVLGAVLFAMGGPGGGVAALAGLIVIVATVAAAIFVMLRWVFTIHAIALENIGAIDALGRSWRLVSGSTWRVLGYLLLLVLLLLAAGLVVGLLQTIIFGLGVDPFTGELWPFDAGRAIGSLVLQALMSIVLTPYYLAVLTLVYYDLRWRRGEQLQPPPG